MSTARIPDGTPLGLTDQDKMNRCAAILEEMDTHQIAIMDLGSERRRLLRELRAAGWGLGKIGAQLGISRARVQQMTGPEPVRSLDSTGLHQWSGEG